MHPNRAFAWEDRDAMLAFLADIAFCTICVEGPALVHAPVIVAGAGPDPLPPVARQPRGGDGRQARDRLLPRPRCLYQPRLVRVAGPGADLELSRRRGGGPLRRLDEAELARLLDDLSAAHEARLAPKPEWTRAKMTPGRFEAMLKAIIGYELSIEDLRGTRKLGQNKKEEERIGAAEGLAPFNPDMAALMRGAPR